MRILIWSLGAGMPTMACVQSGSPRTSSTPARIDASNSVPVTASILSQFVRSSPRAILALICLAVQRTVSLFFRISRPPCRDNSHCSVAPRPYDHEESPLNRTNAQKSFLVVPWRRHCEKGTAIKQREGHAEKIYPAFRQHPVALWFVPAKFHISAYPQLYPQSSQEARSW